MESKIESKILEAITLPLQDLGLEAVRLKFQGGNRKVLEVAIAHLNDKKISLEDCKNVSHTLSVILDVENLIKDKYFLEICSAGLERPLVKWQDYERFVGRSIKVKTKVPHNNNTVFKGKLLAAINGAIKLASKNVILDFNYDNIKEANLIVTDETFKEILKQTK